MSQWKKRLTAIAVTAAVILAVPTAVFAVKSILEPDPPPPSQVVTVSAAQITAEAPEAGKAPSTITADGDDYVISSYEWLEGDKEVTGAFEGGKQYSLKVTLKANDYAKFTAFKPSVSGAESVTNGTLDSSHAGNRIIFTAAFPKTEEGTAPVVQQKSYLSYQNGEINLVAKFSDAENILYNLGPKGPNSLFEFKKVNIVSIGLNGEDAVKDGGWNLMSSSTDCFGPYVVSAVNNPTADGDTYSFTGGNHNYSNAGTVSSDPKDSPTAEMVSLKVFADGTEVSEGFSGYADEIIFEWVNDIQGNNTKIKGGGGRAILRENYRMVFDGDTFHVSNEITILEDCRMKTYYGLQLPNPWASDGIKYVDAANTKWNPTNASNNCGDKTCASFICKRGSYNCQVSIDPTVGIGSREYLNGSNNYAAFNESYAKAYFHLFRDVSRVFKGGETFRFEGTYRYFSE